MAFKDYYKILEVTPAATYADIKKSYRRLALQYHPDKNFGNQLFEAKFREILEAYQVLSDAKQRQDYNTRRSYEADANKKRYQPVTTPQTILNQAIEVHKKIAVLDPERMNKVALYHQIQHLLARPNLAILQQNSDTRINKRIIEEILFCSRFLPFAQVEKICYQLTAIAGPDNTMYRTIYNFSKEIRRRDYWNKYKLLVAMIITFLICLFIYFVTETY